MTFVAMRQDGVRHTVGNPVQLVICEPLSFSFDGKSLGIAVYLFLEPIRYRLFDIFFPKLDEWISRAHTEMALMQSLKSRLVLTCPSFLPPHQPCSSRSPSSSNRTGLQQKQIPHEPRPAILPHETRNQARGDSAPAAVSFLFLCLAQRP